MTSSQSHLMAEMTMDLADKEAGAFSFSQGTTTYEVKDKQVIVRVASKGQIKTYRYVKKQEQKQKFSFLFDMIEGRRKS